MKPITMSEIVEANGLPQTTLANPVVTRRLAAELKRRGYSPVTVRYDGVLRRAWVIKELRYADINAKAMLEKVLGKGPGDNDGGDPDNYDEGVKDLKVEEVV